MRHEVVTPFSDALLQLDYLVFSSHKTGTQTLRGTIERAGLKCAHCHVAGNIGLEDSQLRGYLDSYLERNQRTLKVITVFREPLQRHVSSFFQWYGSRPLRLGTAKDETETIIHRHSIASLQAQFIAELADKSLGGYEESIHEITNALSLDIGELSYDRRRGVGRYENARLTLYLFRFDLLFGNLDARLRELTGVDITVVNDNVSAAKWYRDIFRDFTQSLRIPRDIIASAYADKRDIIEVFYPGQYDTLLDAAIAAYGDQR